jgi:hypothetical protein
MIVNSNEAFFFKKLTENCSPSIADAINQIFDWSQSMHGHEWGDGKKNPSFHILGQSSKVAYIAADGWVWLAFGELRKVPPFSSNPGLLDELVDRLRAVPGLELIYKPCYPHFDLRKVVQLGALSAFLDVLAWAMGKLDQA